MNEIQDAVEKLRALVEQETVECEATLGEVVDSPVGGSVRCNCCGAESTEAPYLYTLKHNRIPNPAYAGLLNVLREVKLMTQLTMEKRPDGSLRYPGLSVECPCLTAWDTGSGVVEMERSCGYYGPCEPVGRHTDGCLSCNGLNRVPLKGAEMVVALWEYLPVGWEVSKEKDGRVYVWDGSRKYGEETVGGGDTLAEALAEAIRKG